MRDLENKPDEELLFLTFGRHTTEFTPILRDRVVEVDKQGSVISLALGVYAFSGQISCNSGQKMILTEFFARKKICRTNSFIRVKILVARACFLTSVVFVSGNTSAGNFASQ
jgi:hypothetical protein